MNSTECIVLLLPHADGNTTSIGRFKSFIAALVKHYTFVKVVYFTFPASGNLFLGIDNSTVDETSITKIYANNLITVKPKLNSIQSLFFKLSTPNNRMYVKPLLWLHQFIYGNDIFTPTNINGLINTISNLQISKGYVIACGGPFGIFNIAKNLSTKLNYKLILDYRDPYTYGFAPIDGSVIIHRIKQVFKRKYELKLVKTATFITTVSNSLKNFFPKEIQNKIFVMPNGSNININEATINPNPKYFNIVYAGTLYNTQLTNEFFFKALKIFIKDKDQSIINLFFLGSSGNVMIKKLLHKYNLTTISTVTPRLNKIEMLNHMCNATCFLHLKYGNNTGVITSKQADYLAFKKAILLPASDNGDLAESIFLNKSGAVCDNVNEIVEFLNSLWIKHSNKQSLIVESCLQTLETRETVANNFIKLLKSHQNCNN